MKRNAMYFTKHCQQQIVVGVKALKGTKLSVYDARVGKPVALATFGGNMRRAREARQLTLEALAVKLGLKRAAPLSTLERSTHVPKTATITEYAAAIGCDPKDLLAGVVTDLDALRGQAAPLPARTTPDRTLTPTETRAVRLIGLMSDVGQTKALGLLASLAAAFPREPAQQSRPPAVQTSGATTRKASGKR